MTILALGSTKGSPGVTTTATLLAATWPDERPALVVEADPDGGSLIPSVGLSSDGGLVAACAASRREMSSDEMWTHTEELPGGVYALVGPPSPEQAVAALKAGDHLASTLADLDAIVIVDCGRLRPDSPAKRFVRSAELLLVVTRPRLDEVWHLAHQSSGLRDAGSDLGLVLIGSRPYAPEEVSAAVGITLVGALPDDPAGAEVVRAGGGIPRRLERSPLVRAARGVAASAHRVLRSRTTDAPVAEEHARA